MGQLSKYDIINENTLKIIPFDPRRLKGASYDVSPSIIAMSTKLGMLETVYRDKNYPYKLYIYVKSKDTVLIITKEYISVPSNIAGYVVSRVSKVSEGFGHVSTSIDPNWKGALLIALSNPSNKPIKVYVGDSKGTKSNSLATISFHSLNTDIGENAAVYDGMRLTLLKEISYSQRKGVKAWFNCRLHPFKRKFTDFFFNFCNISDLSENSWSRFVCEIQGDLPKPECPCCKNYVDSRKKKQKQHLYDFILTESFHLRFIHGLKKYWPTIWRATATVVFLLVALNLLPENWKSFFESLYSFIRDLL